jgi:Tetratricopeptide repeat
MNGLGTIAGSNGDLLTAIQQFENSLRIEPNQSGVWFNHAVALLKVGLLDGALNSLTRSIVLAPNFPDAHFFHASTLANLGRYDEALAAYGDALRLSPDDPVTIKERGILLQWRGNRDLALREFDRAIALSPDYAEAWVSKAMLLLLSGELPEGFKLYEWRFRMEGWTRSPWKRRRDYATPPWRGEANIEGKTLFVWCEQGFGDMIQFCRYVPLLLSTGANVIFGAPRDLTALFGTLDGTVRIVSDDDPDPAHDFQCPLLSLPFAFGTTMETIPTCVPYLHGDATRPAAWQEALFMSEGCRIGIVWAAGSRVGDDRMVSIEQRKSMPLAEFAPLATVSGCEFFSLQLGPPAKQAATPPAGMVLWDFTEHLKDFSDTAAFMADLDLVISVDTATAHLAGAIGRPVWLLNRHDTDWRWFIDREDSPWYPTMRIFRQPKPGDWSSVILRVAAALREFAGT